MHAIWGCEHLCNHIVNLGNCEAGTQVAVHRRFLDTRSSWWYSALFESIGRPAGSLAWIYPFDFIVAPLAIIYNWVGANCNGHIQKVNASAVVSAAFGFANNIGPQTYQKDGDPGYLPAKTTLMVVIAFAIPITLALRALYVHRNSRRASDECEYRL